MTRAKEQDEEAKEDSLDRPAKRCFIVSPLGKDGSEIRLRADKIKRHIIDKAVVPLGYTTIRSDLVDQSGSITTQIVTDLIEADLVIADLTGHNPNVFYELAIRHAFARPFIQLIEKGESIPFDISAYRTVMVDHRDLDSADEATAQISRMVGAIENGDTVDTPVVQAVNRQILGSSGDPEKKELAQIGQAVDSLRQEVLQLAASRTLSRSSPPNGTMDMLRLMRHVITKISKEGRLTYSDVELLRSGPRSKNQTEFIAALSINDDEPPF